MIDARTRELLLDMRKYAQVTIDMADGLTSAQIEADLKTYLALRRAIEIIGEAASQVDPAVRQTLPVTAWRDIIRTRNVIVHGYARIDIKFLYEIAQHDAPLLIAELDAILGTPNP